jgi:hypothetical protein
MLEAFTIDTFLPLLGDTFRMQMDAASTAEVELVEASPLGTPGGAPPASEPARGAFELVFRAPRGPLPVQRIYRLEHAALGSFELFLVPIGPDEHGMRYQAVFT